MEVNGLGETGDFGGVVVAQATTCGDCDAIVGLSDELGEPGSAGEDVGLASGGEDAVASGGEDVFECLREVGRFIEGPMEGDLHGPGEDDERKGAFDVYGAVRVEQAKDDTGCAAGFHLEDGVTHGGELCAGVMEVSGARPDHDVNGEVCLRDSLTNEAGCGGEATDVEVGAELDALCAAVASGEAVRKGLGAEFEEDVAHGMMFYE